MRYMQHHEPGSRAGPENLRRLSLPSDTNRLIVKCHSKHLMSDTRPGRTCSSRPSGKVQTRTVESSLAVAKRALLGEKPRLRMAS